MFAILLNGPPRSGKDTIANHLQAKFDTLLYPTIRRSLSMPMRKAGFAVLGLGYSDEVYELIKDVPQDIFGGLTLREHMIAFSEQFIKKRYGDDFWGRALLNLPVDFSMPGCFIVPDLGFQAESHYIEGKLGARNVLTVHLHRAGFEWKNDSRRYVKGTNVLLVEHKEDESSAAAGQILDFVAHALRWTL